MAKEILFWFPGRRFLAAASSLMLLALLASGCKDDASSKVEGGSATQPAPAAPLSQLKVGYFANLSHAQAVLGVASGEFAEAIRPTELKTQVFNAGPSLIEALNAKEIDIGYVGPGPALNAHLKGRGETIRVISGAAANGVLIVASKGSGIQTTEQLKGRKIATPQLGNTQDIDAKHYLIKALGQADSDNVAPIPNTEQTTMMLKGEIDAAWVPEPWGSRLIAEADAHLVAEEKDLWPGKQFSLALVVTTPEFLQAHPDVVRRVLAVHHHWTERLSADPEKYLPQLGDALFSLTGKKLPPGVLHAAIPHVTFSDDPLPQTLTTMSQWAFELGFAPHPVEVGTLIDTTLLESVRQAAPAH